MDKATQLEGVLTHWIIGMNGNPCYLFQPKGLDGDNQPINPIAVEAPRLEVKSSDFEKVEVPFEILGTTVTDTASGFKGMAVEFMRHINGCLHVYIQPAGTRTDGKSPIRKCDFDLRSCEGEAITKMSERELKESEKETPSPSGRSFNFSPEIRSISDHR